MAPEQLNRSRRRLTAALAAPVALMLLLTACSGSGTEEAPAAPATSEGSTAAPSDGASTELPESHEAVRSALSELLASDPEPSREDVRGAWVSAGFSPEVVEVSQDGTPTGLAVDSIVSAAPDGEECLVGEIRSGKLEVTTVPALGNGQCLLGDDR